MMTKYTITTQELDYLERVALEMGVAARLAVADTGVLLSQLVFEARHYMRGTPMMCKPITETHMYYVIGLISILSNTSGARYLADVMRRTLGYVYEQRGTMGTEFTMRYCARIEQRKR